MASIIKRRYVVMGGGGVNAKKSTGGGRKVATKVSAEQMKIVREGDVMPVVSRPIDVAARDAKKKKKRMFHTAVTANDSPYSRWQVRIMYYWYKKFKDQPGSEMGGFTRVLHSGKPDNLMDEVPTFVVKPLPEGMDRGYVVLNRPWAFVQWVEKAQIEEEYVFMAEPDHIIVRPIPNLATEYMPAAFSFFYIVPKQNEALLRKWYPASLGPITNIDPIGNSPVIIKKVDLKKIAPLWMNVSIQMKDDPEVDKEFGWVLEMYGYATASAMLGYAHILRRDFQVQPPYDQRLGDTFIIHYTYGNDFTLKGEPMYGKFGEWRFDKRSYSDAPPPRNLTLPPKGTCETVVQLIEKINEASWVLPNWEQT
eukprot:TRINITY_DN4309_c0_g1_i1.p1 TRINITY_DN4309_c0_g1~~TRINITY_DN4309_c0_g1_i1.p1  ORF type:complete len:411 (+),score=69.87 TRINITY_DN4309_c0_g1_i1:140-1234(+)